MNGLIFALLSSSLAAAPVDLAPRPPVEQPSPIVSNVPGSVHQPVSIYQLSPWIDGSVLAVTGLAIAIPYALSSSLIQGRCPCNSSDVNPLDRGVIGNNSNAADAVSNFLSFGVSAAPVLVDLIDVGVHKEFLEDMVVYAETLTVNSALVTAAKYTFQRPLPIVYAGQAPGLYTSPRGYRSFYSGHTSSAVSSMMALSMTYTLRHGNRWWPFVLTGVVGISMAALRVEAGRHFYTDVAAGAAAGVIVGYAVPELHKRAQIGNLTVAPVRGGAMVGWAKAF